MSADEEVVINTRLAGTRQFLAAAAAEAAAIREMQHATGGLGQEMKTTTRRGFLMNQAIFTIRRFVYGGTLALIGMTTAAVGLGLAFNANMEMNTVSIAHFVGSVQVAKNELGFLYNLAAHTPFEFQQVTDAARRFLAFGFSLQDVNKYLAILGDTAAGLGLGNEGISRLVIVFGQMRASGRVLGGDLLQLAQAGVPALQILQKQLHLTQEQMANIGQLRIPAAVAIPALMRGLNQQFHGLAKEQAKTFTGQLSTLHDYASQFVGTLTLPLFNTLRDRIFPQMTVLTQKMSEAAKTGGLTAAVKAMDEQITPRSHKIMTIWIQMTGMLGDLWTVITNVTIALTRTRAVIAAIVAPFLIFRGLLFVAAHTTGLWIPLLQLIVTWLIIKRAWILADAFATRFLGEQSVIAQGYMRGSLMLDMLIVRWKRIKVAWALREGIMNGRLTLTYFRLNIAMLITVVRYRLMVVATRLWVAVSVAARLAVILLTEGFWALTAAIMANPLMWLPDIIILIVTGLVILYMKWDWFRGMVNLVGHAIYRSLVDPWVILWHEAERAWGLLKRIANWVRDHSEDLNPFRGGIDWNPLHRKFWLGFASGGTVAQTGSYMVGERGPELVTMPRGSHVTANKDLQPVFSRPEAWMDRDHSWIIKIFLDGTELSESHAQVLSSAEARA